MMTMSTDTACGHAAEDEDDQYARLLEGVRDRFARATATSIPLFTTTATGLWDTFLAALPEDRQKRYTCNACRRFVERFGGLVVLGRPGDGTGAVASSVLWDGGAAPPFFQASMRAMERAVHGARVAGVFLSGEKGWGTPFTRDGAAGWHHLAVTPAAGLLFSSPTLTAEQKMAEKLQDHGTLRRALAEFPVEVARQAHHLLASGNTLYRAEAVLGVATWFLALQEEIAGAGRDTRTLDNLTWRAVAMAPAGWCHIRSTMIGTLLADIASGELDFNTIKARFDAKMAPGVHMRPQAPPTDGNLAQAEKVVEKLASAGALRRRFARLGDVEALWAPRPVVPTAAAPTAGVFGHLRQQPSAKAAPIEAPPVTMTWDRFLRTVLPEAATIELLTPSLGSYGALVTAVDPSAPPILQYDRADRRNPVSWYVYVGGSSAAQWGLAERAWCPVSTICLQPSLWYGGGFPHLGEKVFFLLAGAADMNGSRAQGFFPSLLRSDYHPIRASMEAYAKRAGIEGPTEGMACGMVLQSGQDKPWNQLVRVIAKNGARSTFNLDRWV